MRGEIVKAEEEEHYGCLVRSWHKSQNRSGRYFGDMVRRKVRHRSRRFSLANVVNCGRRLIHLGIVIKYSIIIYKFIMDKKFTWALHRRCNTRYLSPSLRPTLISCKYSPCGKSKLLPNVNFNTSRSGQNRVVQLALTWSRLHPPG